MRPLPEGMLKESSKDIHNSTACLCLWLAKDQKPLEIVCGRYRIDMAFSEKTLSTDVLVIGAGFAACFSALMARQLGAEVTMIEQLKSGYSGMSSIGTQVNRVVLPEDDLDLPMEGIARLVVRESRRFLTFSD
jgi:heterodisulfide reductase subunit A-like polyferredoxin